MTAEDAIAILTGAQAMVLNRNTDVFVAAVNRAIISLHLERQRNNPKPLTIEDLKQMKGEPVWIVWPDGRVRSRWWIVESSEWLLMEFFEPIMARRYGGVWVAYRHKPKED